MKKILVIGQAPPAVKQKIPYDTTMIYSWLEELGIDKNEAQNMFEWEAMYDKFPGYDKGAHAVPTEDEMRDYWETKLKYKVEEADRIWLLGTVAAKFFNSRPSKYWKDKIIVDTLHPSKRNLFRYNKNKNETLDKIKYLLNI